MRLTFSDLKADWSNIATSWSPMPTRTAAPAGAARAAQRRRAAGSKRDLTDIGIPNQATRRELRARAQRADTASRRPPRAGAIGPRADLRGGPGGAARTAS